MTAPISSAPRAGQFDLAAGDRDRHRVGAVSIAVRQHGVLRRVQRRDALDDDARGAEAEIFAPIAIRQRPRSSISGSRAAFSITVSPSASEAAISVFSVAPTETMGNSMRAPFKPRGAGDDHIALFELDLGAERSSAFKCRSTGRAPMAQPPGSETFAWPARATSGPVTRKLARILRTIS